MPKYSSIHFQPLYRFESNYESTAFYPRSVTKEIEAMLVNNVVRKCDSEDGEIIHPIDAVVKGSDKTRSMALLGIAVMDQDSLNKANTELLTRLLN